MAQRIRDRFGVEAMVTDDLSTYKPVVEHLGVDHQSLPVLDTRCVSRTSESGCGIDWLR